MVAIKIKQNERLVKDNKGLTEKTNVLAQDVVDSKKLGEALSNQLTKEEEKMKVVEIEMDAALGEKKLVKDKVSKLCDKIVELGQEKENLNEDKLEEIKQVLCYDP